MQIQQKQQQDKDKTTNVIEIFRKRFPGLNVKYHQGDHRLIYSYNVVIFDEAEAEEYTAMEGAVGYATKEGNLDLLQFCMDKFPDCNPWTPWCLKQSLWWLFFENNPTIMSYLMLTIPGINGVCIVDAWKNINHIMEGFLYGGSSRVGGFDDWPDKIKEVIPPQLFMWLDSKKIEGTEQLEELFQIKHEQQLFVLAFLRSVVLSFIYVKPLVQIVLDYCLNDLISFKNILLGWLGLWTNVDAQPQVRAKSHESEPKILLTSHNHKIPNGETTRTTTTGFCFPFVNLQQNENKTTNVVEIIKKQFQGLDVQYYQGDPELLSSYSVGGAFGVVGYAVNEANLDLLRFCVDKFPDCNPWKHWCLERSLIQLFRVNNSTIISYLMQTIPRTNGDCVVQAWEDINHIMEGFLTGGSSKSSKTGGFDDWPDRIKEVIPPQLFLWLYSGKIEGTELEELFQIKHEQQLFVLASLRSVVLSFIYVKPLVEIVLDYLCSM